MKIAYLHGLESSINQKDPKIKFLNKGFNKVYSPSINYKDDNTFSKLYKDIKSLNPDLIVGSSMGGYVSYLIGSKLSIPVLLFNPAIVDREFDPVVDNSNLKKTKINIQFGKNDSVISGVKVRKHLNDNKVSFTHKEYDGGHRVPADVFINSIKDVLNMNEVHTKIGKIKPKMKHIKLFEQFIPEAKQFGAKEMIKAFKNSDDWGDAADQVYMKGGNMVFVDTWFYGEGKAMKQLEDSWKKGGSYYDYWNKEYGVDFKIVDTFSEVKAQGRHKKLTKDGIVGVVLKVTPGTVSESKDS
jgi:predicted esterase YcpF (UPF0227 family)